MIAPTSHLDISSPPRRRCIRGDRWVGRRVLWPWGTWRMPPVKNKYYREEKVSQLQKVTSQMNLPTVSHLQSSSPTRRWCLQGDSTVGWSWRMVWGVKQTMADEEVRNRFFCEHIKTSAQKQACHHHLTFFFRPPLAVDVYKRLRGSDRVHDGGEGQHEVSPCLVLVNL